MRTLRFEPSAAQRCETTPEHCDGGPEGVTSEARNNPSLSAKDIKNPAWSVRALVSCRVQRAPRGESPGLRTILKSTLQIQVAAG